jgi:hypothetical protein
MGEPADKPDKDKPEHPHEGGPPGQNPDFVPPGHGGTPPGQTDKPDEEDEEHPAHPIVIPEEPEPEPKE